LSRVQRTIGIAILSVAAALVLLNFAPIGGAVFWHLMSGDKVQYQGRVAYLPLNWITTPKAWANTNDLSLIRLPGSLFGARYMARLTIYEDRSRAMVSENERYALWRRAMDNRSRLYPGTVTRSVSLTEDGQHECVLFIDPVVTNRVEQQCLLFDRTWFAIFDGSPSTLGEANRILKEFH
jgi:hypothetical protein